MNLNKGLALINKDSELTEKLDAIYDQVPSGDCKGCLRCCTESVNTFFVEYVHILAFLRNNPQVLLDHAEKISRFFLLEMMEEMYCPFVDGRGRCAIYPARPLPCRVFGHLTEEDYNRNYDQVRASNEDIGLYFEQNYGLKLPSAVIERKIPYCKDFVSEMKIAIEDRDDWVDLLFSLDSRFLMNEVIGFEDVNQSLVTWFLKSVMPIEEAGDYRIKAMTYYQNGDQRQLEKLINEISAKLIKLNTI